MLFKSFLFISIFLMLIFTVSIYAQDSTAVYNLDEDITVTATRIPTNFADVARTLSVIKKAEIQQTAAQSIPELLENISGIDIQQRGSQGVQADISIRGAGFNQTLILVNGIKISDPQTGHHNMNLPVDISDIEQIEILKGPGSRLYGPNAFGGVINILTSKNRQLSSKIGGSFGENNLYNSFFNVNLPWAASSHRFTLAKSGSDGYRYNTDFQSLTFAHNSSFYLSDFNFELSSGFNEKQFGANNFYLPQFNNPDQYEETKLVYFQGGISYKKDNFSINQKIYFRRHNDDYFWRKNVSIPSQHETNVYGTEIQGNLNTQAGITSVGLEYAGEEIASTSLGTANQPKDSKGYFHHDRKRSGFFIQQQVAFNAFILSAGISVYHYTGQGWHGWPGFDVSFKVNENSKIYASYSEGFRVPTYSNYYLNLPGALGNANLENEQSKNYELGYTFMNSKFNGEIAVFNRRDKNLIDYVFGTDSLYHAENFTKLITTGLEVHLAFNNPGLGLNSVFANYAYLNLDVDLFGKNTLYILTHFRHQLILGTSYGIPLAKGLSQSWKIRYEDRYQSTQQTTVDTRLSLHIKKWHVFMDVTNILDEKFEEISGIPAPGRWLKVGFEYNIFNE